MMVGLSAASRSLGREYLRNLLVTPLQLFNSVADGTRLQVPATDGPRPDLPVENSFMGSYAREVEYVAPARWTIYAYMASGGVLLLLIGCATTWTLASVLTAKKKISEPSIFPLVDFLRLDHLLTVRGTGEHPDEIARADLTNVFRDESLRNDHMILRDAANVRVVLKERQAGSNGD